MSTGTFFLRIILAMVPCFALWWFSGDWWLQPAVSMADSLLSFMLPDSFHRLDFNGSVVQIISNWGEVQGRAVPARAAGYALAFETNIRILSYSFPFFFSLQAALWCWQPKLRMAISFVVLYMVLAISLVFICAKSMMVGLGGAFIEATRYWYVSKDVIALSYQLSTLMLPVLVPVFLWIMTNQERLVEMFLKPAPLAPLSSEATEPRPEA